jgi:hypothetical protein
MRTESAGGYDNGMVPNQIDRDQQSSPLVDLLVTLAVVVAIAGVLLVL